MSERLTNKELEDMEVHAAIVRIDDKTDVRTLGYLLKALIEIKMLKKDLNRMIDRVAEI